MSAILGRIELTGRPVDSGGFAQAMDALAHYGRDGSEMLVHGNAGLGKHHLEVARRVGADAGPLRLGALVIVADAVIDNRAELAESLGLSPHERQIASDSALILASYQKWGRDCTRHLVGDFAFAIHDMASGTLFLARDHVGARPLFWFQSGQTVLFATDIRGLLAFSEFGWSIDEFEVAQFLHLPVQPLETGSFFRGVRRVEPAETVAISPDGVSRSEWWTTSQARDVRFARFDDYAAGYRELLERAVADRVDTRHHVGSHISGGLDSTSVTTLAARRLRQTGAALRAGFTWAPAISEQYPEGGKGDERLIIDAVCARDGFRCSYGSATGQTAHDSLSREIELDGTADVAQELQVLENAAALDVRVLLSGWGGDETVSTQSIGYLPYLLKTGRFARLASGIRAASGGRRNPAVLARTFWRSAVAPLLPKRLGQGQGGFPNIYDGGCFVHPEFAEKYKKAIETEVANADTPHSDPGLFMAAMLKHGHLGARMETWAAWSAPFAIQHRYPFLDRRVIEFVFGLPYEILFDPQGRRHFAMAALGDCLTGSPRKFDYANEKLRHDTRVVCWSLLAEDQKAGRYDNDSAWVDMSSLRKTLAKAPDRIGREDLVAFAKMSAALKVVHMEQRERRCSSSSGGVHKF